MTVSNQGLSSPGMWRRVVHTICFAVWAVSANTISPQSIGPAYGVHEATGIRLHSMVGECIVGTATGGGVELTSGFLALVRGAIINEKPRVTSDTVITVRVNDFFTYRATATDREGPVTVGYIDIPSWTIVSAGMISGTPTRETGDTSFKVVAFDGSLYDTVKVKVIVLTPNTPVAITSPLTSTATEHVHYVYQATVRDPQTLLSISFKDVPSWLRAAGDSLSGKPPEGAVDTSFTIVATGVSSSDIKTVTLRVIPVDDPPVITSPSIVQVLTNTQLGYKARAYDPEGKTVRISFENLPSWLTVTSSGDSLTGTPSNANLDTSFVVVARDDSLTTRLKVSVFVRQHNTPPTITSPDSVHATQHRRFVYRATAFDPDETVLLFSFPSQLPSWLTAQGDSVFGTPLTRGIGTISFTVRVSDGLAAVQKIVTVTVKDSNDLPVFVQVPDTTILSLVLFRRPVTANDPDGIRTYALVTGPTGMIIDSLGFLSWVPTDADSGSKTVTVRATDSLGASAEMTFRILVSPNPRPRISLGPVTGYQRDTVRIPFTIYDFQNDTVSLDLWYRLPRSSDWVPSTAILGGKDLIASQYVGLLTWITTSEQNLPGKLLDSVRVRVLPRDKVHGFPDSTGWFRLDNSPALKLVQPFPAPGSRVRADRIPVITIQSTGARFEPSSVTDMATVTMAGAQQSTVAIKVECKDSLLTIVPYEPLRAGETFTVKLSGRIKDNFGKFIDGNGDGRIDTLGREDYSWNFRTGYAGDLTGNDSVGFNDLIAVRRLWYLSAENDWNKIDTIQEIGPATGAAPHFQIQRDSIFDYRDLSVFLRMWYWMQGRSGSTPGGSLAKRVEKVEGPTASGMPLSDLEISPRPAKADAPPAFSSVKTRFQNYSWRTATVNSRPELILDLGVEGIENLSACRYRIWGVGGIGAIDMDGSILEQNGSALALTRTGGGWQEACLARFSVKEPVVEGSGRVTSLRLTPPSQQGARVTLEYELVDNDGERIETGVIDLGESPVVVPQESGKGRTGQALVAAPNPMRVASRSTGFEFVDRPEAARWVVNENAGGIFSFTLQVPDQPGAVLRCELRIRNRDRTVIHRTALRDVAPEIRFAGGRKTYMIYWNGRDRNGLACPVGVYEVELFWDNGRTTGSQKFGVGIR